jgi:hypothetical protein
MNNTTIQTIISVVMVHLSLLKSAASASTFVKYFNLSMEQTAIRMFPAHLPKIVCANGSPTTRKIPEV